MILPLDTNMKIIGKRFPLYVDYEVGVNDKGVVQYMDSNLYTDYGKGGNEPVDPFLIPLFENHYDYSTWNFSTNTVTTDTPANTYTRAPGKIQFNYRNQKLIESYRIVIIRINRLFNKIQNQ